MRGVNNRESQNCAAGGKPLPFLRPRRVRSGLCRAAVSISAAGRSPRWLCKEPFRMKSIGQSVGWMLVTMLDVLDAHAIGMTNQHVPAGRNRFRRLDPLHAHPRHTTPTPLNL